MKIIRNDPILQRCQIDIGAINDHWMPPNVLPACYLINSANNDEDGEHWLAFIIDTKKDVDYFDSYGTAPLQKIYDWLIKHGCRPIRYNMKMIQGFTTKTCGAYCAYFLHMRAMGIPLDMIQDTFHEYDHKFNDLLVRALLKQLK